MADPHLTPTLDGFDRFTVRAYRAGLVLAALGLGWLALASFRDRPVVAAWWFTFLGVVLSVGHIHLYDKRVRWVITWLAWSGLLVRASMGLVPPASVALASGWSTGLVLAALGMVVVKEWFCFRIPLIRWTPLALAVGVFARFLDAPQVAGVAFGLAALAVWVVAVAKLRMPLSHDIGDRSAYQV